MANVEKITEKEIEHELLPSAMILGTKKHGGVDKVVRYPISKIFENTFDISHENRLTELTNGYYFTKSGELVEHDYFYYSNTIAVSTGETITYQAVMDGVRSIVEIYIVTAYAADGSILPDAGAENVLKYVVPEGVAYIVCSFGYTEVDNYTERAVVASASVVPFNVYTLKPSTIPYIKNNVPNAIKETLSGPYVTAADVSPIEHDLKVKLTSQNLLKFKENKPEAAYGLTFEYDDNGGIIISGTCESTATVYFWDKVDLTPGIYTISGGYAVDGKSYASVLARKNKLSWIDSTGIAEDVKYATGKFDELDEFERFGVLFRSGRTFDRVRICPKFEKAAAASSEDAPWRSTAGVKVKRSRKNILPIPYWAFEKAGSDSITKAGVTFMLNSNGSISVVGTATSDIFFNLRQFTEDSISMDNILKPGTSYRISGKYLTFGYWESEEFVGTMNGRIDVTSTDEKVIEWKEGYAFRVFFIHLKNGSFYNEVIYPMIEVGTSVSPYEKYTEPTEYIADADGNVEIPSLSPSITLETDEKNVNIECTYNRDSMKIIEELTNAIISLGGLV